MKEILKDKAFFKASGGGLTVSGGEPMLQIDFLECLLALAQSEGIHTAVETSGYAPPRNFERIAPFTNCFLFDYKETNPEKHLCFTGKDQSLIIDNLAFLNNIKAQIILRVPLVPGYNDTIEHMNGIKKTAWNYPSIQKIEVLPYHPLGVSKEADLGWQKKDKIEIPKAIQIKNFIEELQNGLSIKVEACI